MKRSKFSEEQIVYAIRKAESGTPIGDLCPQLGVSATFYTCKKKYAHLGVSELRRLRQVEEENSRLKRLVAYRSIMELNYNHALWRIGPIRESVDIHPGCSLHHKRKIQEPERFDKGVFHGLPGRMKSS